MEEPNQDKVITTDLWTRITHPAGDLTLHVTETFLRKHNFKSWFGFFAFSVSAARMRMTGSSRQQLAERTAAELFIAPVALKSHPPQSAPHLRMKSVC